MAFVPGVDIMENIEVDSFLWEWCRAHQEREDGSGHLHAAYLDCSKAYDSVPPWLTRAAMRAHKMPPEFVEKVCGVTGPTGQVAQQVRPRQESVDEMGRRSQAGYSGLPALL